LTATSEEANWWIRATGQYDYYNKNISEHEIALRVFNEDVNCWIRATGLYFYKTITILSSMKLHYECSTKSEANGWIRFMISTAGQVTAPPEERRRL